MLCTFSRSSGLTPPHLTTFVESFLFVLNHRTSRQAEGKSEQVTDQFGTVRGSGWPGLTQQQFPVSSLDSWPSATANGTE
jgi:hypothetical protein